MRDLLVFAIVLLSLPTCFRRPYFGMLVFSWLAYMRPQDLCWGFARSMRLSFFVGLAMVLGWWANEQGRRRFTRWDVRTSGMVALGIFVSIGYLFADIQTPYSNRYFFEFLKIILVALFTVGQVDSKERLRLMIWVIALCFASFGVKNGLLSLLRGGAAILRGPGGMLEDNNDFALAMVMNVPLLWYLGISDAKLPFVRLGTRAAIGLTVVTVVLTHSRGAFLALCSTALYIAWRSGKLIRATFALALCGVAFLAFAPKSVLDRLATIGDTQESSAAARLTAWRTAFRMIADNPLFGVGLRNFQPRYVEYSGEVIGDKAHSYVAHNSYLQIWAENGSLAFFVYLTLLFSVFVTCRRVHRMSRLRPDLAWMGDYTRMMEATTAGFMVGAVFLNRGHFDLVYHWLALVTSLGAIAGLAWLRGPAPEERAGRVGRGEVAVRRRRVFAAVGTHGSKLQPRWGRTT